MSSILHTNISSISKNLENIEILLENLDHKFDIIGLSETWRNENNDDRIKQLNIEGFHNYIGQIGTNSKGVDSVDFWLLKNYHFMYDLTLTKLIKIKVANMKPFGLKLKVKQKRTQSLVLYTTNPVVIHLPF